MAMSAGDHRIGDGTETRGEQLLIDERVVTAAAGDRQ
jgi:hypothetical protein